MKQLHSFTTSPPQVQDKNGMRRKVLLSTEVEQAVSKNFKTEVPLKMDTSDNWQHLQVDLEKILADAFNAAYERTVLIRVGCVLRGRRLTEASENALS